MVSLGQNSLFWRRRWLIRFLKSSGGFWCRWLLRFRCRLLIRFRGEVPEGSGQKADEDRRVPVQMGDEVPGAEGYGGDC